MTYVSLEDFVLITCHLWTCFFFCFFFKENGSHCLSFQTRWRRDSRGQTTEGKGQEYWLDCPSTWLTASAETAPRALEAMAQIKTFPSFPLHCWNLILVSQPDNLHWLSFSYLVKTQQNKVRGVRRVVSFYAGVCLCMSKKKGTRAKKACPEGQTQSPREKQWLLPFVPIPFL